MHSNANVLGSHSNANVLVTLANGFELISNVGFILTICFIWRKNNIMYTNTLLIYLINTVVHYCNHYVPLHEHVCRVVHRVTQLQACRGGGNGREE